MQRILAGLAIVAVALPAAIADTPELFVMAGNASNTALVNGTGSTVSYSNSDLGGWDISAIIGSSNSPGLIPYGLQVTSISAECLIASGCGNLYVWFSDIGFTSLADQFTSSFSITESTRNGSAEQKAWVGLGDKYFQADGTGESLSGGTAIPVVGQFQGNGSFGGDTSADIFAGPSAYSLTIEDIFGGCKGTSCDSYGGTGQITGEMPEPASLALFGTALLGCGWRLRRRTKAGKTS